MRPTRKHLLVCALAFASMAAGTAAAWAQPSAFGAPQRPTSFRFEIDEVTVKIGGEVVFHDLFDRPGELRPTAVQGSGPDSQTPEYRVDLGRISGAAVNGGVLAIDQDLTTNHWLGPKGTYGHNLHRNDSYVAMLTLPISADGRTTFLAREAYGLEYSIRLKAPRFTGFEKLKIGLMDTEAYNSRGAIGVGRLPLPLPAPGQVTEAGTPRIIDITDLVSEPSVILGRVEEPRVSGEIVLDHAAIDNYDEIETLEMTLRMGPEGELSGHARIVAGGRVQEVELEPLDQEPQEFFGPRSKIPPDVRLAATLFIETLPGLEVVHVAPKQMMVADLAGEDTVRFRVEGFGFGPDTRVEVVPKGTAATAIPASAILRQRQKGTPEGTVLLADVDLPKQAGSYDLRISTGSQSQIVEDAVQVLETSTSRSSAAIGSRR
jgi:hypothetical protein